MPKFTCKPLQCRQALTDVSLQLQQLHLNPATLTSHSSNSLFKFLTSCIQSHMQRLKCPHAISDFYRDTVWKHSSSHHRTVCRQIKWTAYSM